MRFYSNIVIVKNQIQPDFVFMKLTNLQGGGGDGGGGDDDDMDENLMAEEVDNTLHFKG